MNYLFISTTKPSNRCIILLFFQSCLPTLCVVTQVSATIWRLFGSVEAQVDWIHHNIFCYIVFSTMWLVEERILRWGQSISLHTNVSPYNTQSHFHSTTFLAQQFNTLAPERLWGSWGLRKGARVGWRQQSWHRGSAQQDDEDWPQP